MISLSPEQIIALICGVGMILLGLVFIARYLKRIVVYVYVLRATDSDLMSPRPGDRVSLTGDIFPHPHYGALPLHFTPREVPPCLYATWDIRAKVARWRRVSNSDVGVVMTFRNNGRTYTVNSGEQHDVLMLSDPETVLYARPEHSDVMEDFLDVYHDGEHREVKGLRCHVRYSMLSSGDEVRIIGTITESEDDSESRYTLTGSDDGLFGLSRLFITDMSNKRMLFEIVKSVVGIGGSLFFVFAGFVFGSFQIISVPFAEYAGHMLFMAAGIVYAYIYARDVHLFILDNFAFTEYLPFTNR